MNNNSAKVRKTPDANDDEDVETAHTADADTLLPQKLNQSRDISNLDLSDLYELQQVSLKLDVFYEFLSNKRRHFLVFCVCDFLFKLKVL